MQRILILFLIVGLFACEESADLATAPGGNTGQGGSLARFTIVGDYLYTLEPNQLSWFKIAVNGNLTEAGQLNLGGNKETIFPLGNLLFLGASEGMSIFQIEANGEPVFQSEVFHIVACDPVVANENYAFVTLRTESCNLFGRETENLLNIYDVNDVTNPDILASYDMISPRGLGLAGDYLFVCEGPFGLRTLKVDDPQSVDFINFDEDIHANDVIVLPEMLLVIGPDNITQFDYSDPTDLVKISEIRIE
ncbi:MAG: hypothetical protein AAFO03_07135 [Bacteroidota bacterium]